MAKVKCPEELTKETICLILQEHFNNSKLKVISLNGNETFLAKNDNLNSEVKKWTVELRLEENGETIFFLNCPIRFLRPNMLNLSHCDPLCVL